MSKEIRTEVAVVGLGAMGSATLYQFARLGVPALGIDRFAPPHDLGSSHGETRITRQGVGEGRSYVPLALASHRIWRELEAETGETLLVSCGALVIGPGDGNTFHHGMTDFVTRTAESARAFSIPHELMDGREVRRRHPHLAGLDGYERAYFEPGGGYLRPERCIAAQLRRAGELGAGILTGREVRSVRQDAGGVRLDLGDVTVRAEKAVVSAGAWNAGLLGPPFTDLLTVSRQVLHWFALEDPEEMPEDAPIFIWMHGAADGDYLYGFPRMRGERSIKLATEQYDTTTDPASVDRTVAPSESEALYREHVAKRIAGVTGRVERAAACLYTLTPDRGFIIDQHPAMDRVTVVSACSGHGFKHSAGIGLAVAQQVGTGRSEIDLAPFALARFGQGAGKLGLPLVAQVP